MKDYVSQNSEWLNARLERIIKIIDEENRKIENRELKELCKGLGDIFDGNTDPHFYHEVAETSLNVLIKRKYAESLLQSENPVNSLSKVIKPIADRLPTQTWRSGRQSRLQQFSTPPAIAYLLAYLMNMKSGERVLEPSAGTGCLAVWSEGIGSPTQTNEIDRRRRTLLRQIGFSPTRFDAEFINDFLPSELEIDCLMMNPPFSVSGGFTGNNSSRFGFRHVESALERLRGGGRFGIILGKAAGLETRTGNDFWRKLSNKIEIKSIVRINGREYYKNGTTAETNLVIGKKFAEPQNSDWDKSIGKIVLTSAITVEEAFGKARELNLRLTQ